MKIMNHLANRIFSSAILFGAAVLPLAGLTSSVQAALVCNNTGNCVRVDSCPDWDEGTHVGWKCYASSGKINMGSSVNGKPSVKHNTSTLSSKNRKIKK